MALLARDSYLKGTDADLRISLILLDNLAEMLMHRAIRVNENPPKLRRAPYAIAIQSLRHPLELAGPEQAKGKHHVQFIDNMLNRHK